MRAISNHSRRSIRCDPFHGRDGFHCFQIRTVLDTVDREHFSAHSAENAHGGEITLFALARHPIAAPVLFVKAGRTHGAESKHYGDRSFFGIAIGVNHGQGMPRRSAGNGHLVDGVTRRLGRLDYFRDSRLDFVGLGIDACTVGCSVQLLCQGVIDSGGHVALLAEPGKHLYIATFIAGSEAAGMQVNSQSICGSGVVLRQV